MKSQILKSEITVADEQHALMMQTRVRSVRAARVREDFHISSDRKIAGAIAHDAGQFDKHLYHFKFDFLQKQAARLNYDYFVWLDASFNLVGTSSTSSHFSNSSRDNFLRAIRAMC